MLLAEEGLLRVDDPFVAAVHFAALTTAGLTTYYGPPALGDESTSASVVSGVEAFLHGYATPPRPRTASGAGTSSLKRVLLRPTAAE